MTRARSRHERRGRLETRPLSLAIAVATVMAASGCSFFFVKPSAVHPLTPSSECTEGRGWPTLDTLLAVSAGVAAAYAATRSPEEQARSTWAKKDAALGYAVTAAFFGGSAVAGFSRVSDCRTFKAERAPPAPAPTSAPAPAAAPAPAPTSAPAPAPTSAPAPAAPPVP